jgi:hypothetical protein
MQEFDGIGEDLFNKIRGRFPEVTIGDENGTVTNEPTMARFFDFDYNGLGKVSVAIEEDEGLTVIYAKDFMEDQDEQTKEAWYDFLKELRVFSKKRMLNYSVRDITKSNLTKRDYNFLAKTPEDEQMTESKLYGTSRISYQKVGEARIVIKHTEGINQESTTGRTQKIGKIYIESAGGERFRYPFKHLSGARAMARHVAEGGNTYDEFGKHIVGLSEEMAKLRKFKNYMGRSAVMAESLAGYVDVVKERIATVKKTIGSLQKPAYYAEAFAAFETPIMEDVPTDVQENWIDQLTIKQFNEELSDVFPYIYKLVSEATKAQELGPEDLVDESAEELGALKDKYSKDAKNKKTKEEIELERAFEATLGQFSDTVCEECGNQSWETLSEEELEEAHGNSKEYDKCWAGYEKVPGTTRGEKGSCRRKTAKESEEEVQEGTIKTAQDASDALGVLRGKGKKIETGDGEYEGNLANEYANQVWYVYSWIEAKTKGFQDIDPKFQSAIDDMMTLRGEAKKLETKPGSGKNGKFGNQIVNTLYPVMQYIDAHDFNQDEGNAYSGAVAKAKMNGKKKGDEIDGPDGEKIKIEKEEQKTPLGEFILSYYDRENGTFPKGETSILTMVEKDYGEQFIDPAKAFIEQVQALFDNFEMQENPQQMEVNVEDDYNRMRELAGLR